MSTQCLQSRELRVSFEKLQKDLKKKKKKTGLPSSSAIKNLTANAEMWVQFLGQEDSQEQEMASHSSVLAWETPQMEEPGGLQSMGSQRVGHDLVTK